MLWRMLSPDVSLALIAIDSRRRLWRMLWRMLSPDDALAFIAIDSVI